MSNPTKLRSAILHMWSRGYSYADIASCIGKSRCSVAGIIWREGFRDNDRRGKMAHIRRQDNLSAERERQRAMWRTWPSKRASI